MRMQVHIMLCFIRPTMHVYTTALLLDSMRGLILSFLNVGKKDDMKHPAMELAA